MSNCKGTIDMKKILITSVLIVLSILEANADETHIKFLQLRTAAEEAQNAFYAAVTNGDSCSIGKWTNDHARPIQCVSTPTNGVVTNIEYLVSMKTATTNVHTIVQRCRTGIVCNFHYSKDRHVHRIEECGPGGGDFKVFDIGKDGDLESYCAVTNFFAVHGVRHYINGEMVSEDKGLIDFSIFK